MVAIYAPATRLGPCCGTGFQAGGRLRVMIELRTGRCKTGAEWLSVFIESLLIVRCSNPCIVFEIGISGGRPLQAELQTENSISDLAPLIHSPYLAKILQLFW
jgi:hypothetical protein